MNDFCELGFFYTLLQADYKIRAGFLLEGIE
jgi:hypothetical protein